MRARLALTSACSFAPSLSSCSSSVASGESALAPLGAAKSAAVVDGGGVGSALSSSISGSVEMTVEVEVDGPGVERVEVEEGDSRSGSGTTADAEADDSLDAGAGSDDMVDAVRRVGDRDGE